MNDSDDEGGFYDEGYDNGKTDATYQAWELVGQLADFYKNNVKMSDDTTIADFDILARDIQVQVNALKYAQHVIKKGSFDEEKELPW